MRNPPLLKSFSECFSFEKTSCPLVWSQSLQYHEGIDDLYPWQSFTVIDICFFWQLTGIWVVDNHSPKISRTAGRMAMDFLPDINNHREARNPKHILTKLTWSVNYGSTKSKNVQIACFLEMQLLDMLDSQNVAGLSLLRQKLPLKI